MGPLTMANVALSLSVDFMRRHLVYVIIPLQVNRDLKSRRCRRISRSSATCLQYFFLPPSPTHCTETEFSDVIGQLVCSTVSSLPPPPTEAEFFDVLTYLRVTSTLKKNFYSPSPLKQKWVETGLYCNVKIVRKPQV